MFSWTLGLEAGSFLPPATRQPVIRLHMPRSFALHRVELNWIWAVALSHSCTAEITSTVNCFRFLLTLSWRNSRWGTRVGWQQRVSISQLVPTHKLVWWLQRSVAAIGRSCLVYNFRIFCCFAALFALSLLLCLLFWWFSIAVDVVSSCKLHD